MDVENEFARHKDYVVELKKRNKGSIILLESDGDTNEFIRMHVYFYILKKGFKVGVDL